MMMRSPHACEFIKKNNPRNGINETLYLNILENWLKFESLVVQRKMGLLNLP
jgi:hypothetical protein